MERSQDDIMNSSDGARESQGKLHTTAPPPARAGGGRAQATCCVDTAFDVLLCTFQHTTRHVTWDSIDSL